MNRYALFVRRALRAREFGFTFRGTSRTAMPHTVRLGGAKRAIAAPDDPTIVHDIVNVWLDDEYGLRDLRWSVKTVVDVGANIGLFSLLARHRFPDAAIHSYEPDERVLSFTRRNLEGAGIALHPEGVARSRAQGTMIRLGSSRLSQVMPKKQGDVQLVGISEVIDRIGGQVDLLKLDCEGFEWDILQEHRAFERVRSIRMEYHLTEGRDVSDLQSAAGRLNFQITRLSRDQGFGIAWLERG